MNYGTIIKDSDNCYWRVLYSDPSYAYVESMHPDFINFTQPINFSYTIIEEVTSK